MGYRRAVLLDEIGSRESLSEAAEAAEMEYEHALSLLTEMNGVFHAPLVKFYENSTDAGLVRLTETGEEMVRTYWRSFEPVWASILEERSKHY